MTSRAPKGLRLHVGLFGRRNAGKSSLLNALTHQASAIVSSVPGTTTDPVEKAMELQPIGPVLFIDTAGIDDAGSLGEERVRRTRRVIERTELALLVAPCGTWDDVERTLLAELREGSRSTLVVFTHADLCPVAKEHTRFLDAEGIPWVAVSTVTELGMAELRRALLRAVPQGFLEPTSILSDLLPPGGLAVLVVPIDKEAPRGRLILPQVQAIRDLLDGDQMALVVKERELGSALRRLGTRPDLIVTDSQAFLKVAADAPRDVPLTSFSILFARFKGDLRSFTEGVVAIDRLRPGDRVLVAEACAHHPITEDIGRVKIPRWLTQYVGGDLAFTHVQGHDFPDDLASYRLAIHCGACTHNRQAVLSRIQHCRERDVPITNYGMCIAHSLGILERALTPFPAARELYRDLQGRRVP